MFSEKPSVSWIKYEIWIKIQICLKYYKNGSIVSPIEVALWKIGVRLCMYMLFIYNSQVYCFCCMLSIFLLFLNLSVARSLTLFPVCGNRLTRDYMGLRTQMVKRGYPLYSGMAVMCTSANLFGDNRRDYI